MITRANNRCILRLPPFSKGGFDSQSDEPLPPRPKGKKPSRNAPNFDLRSHLYRISGVDFTQIDGLEALTVQEIISEVGLDPNRFSTSKHFTSWLGICPGSKISGGKILSSKTRKVVNRASNGSSVFTLPSPLRSA